MTDPFLEKMQRDYRELPWPSPERDVVREVLNQARPLRFPGRRWLAVAAVLVVALSGWWATRPTETVDAAALMWDGDAVLAEEMKQLKLRLGRAPDERSWSLPETSSVSSRTGNLRRRLDRLKRDVEFREPKAESPVGTHGGKLDEEDIA